MNKLISIRNVGFGVVALLATLPLLYAQHSQSSGRGAPAPFSEPAHGPRSEPAHGPRSEPVHEVTQHSPVMVDRSAHGSIRHVDAHVVEHPVEVHRDFNAHQQVIVHHDRDVDVNRPRYWHSFLFGARRHGLREGCLPLFVNGVPFFYDDGIYYQQAGDDYTAVYPPVGATIPALPDGAIEIFAGNMVYYYAGGAFYVQQDGGFVIAPTPMGVVVPELPPGNVMVMLSGRVVYQFNGIYYQPVFVNGLTQYQTFMP